MQAGDAGPNAVRRTDFFLRDLDHAREFAARAWEEESVQWIGEWHTHPVSGPQPSGRDLATYNGLLRDTELGFSAFVSVIVTPHPDRGWFEPILTTWVLTAASG